MIYMYYIRDIFTTRDLKHDVTVDIYDIIRDILLISRDIECTGDEIGVILGRLVKNRFILRERLCHAINLYTDLQHVLVVTIEGFWLYFLDF